MVVIILRKDNKYKMSIAFQPNLVNQLPKVVNNKDYDDYKNTILGIDEVLRLTGLDFYCAMQHLMVKYSGKKYSITEKKLLCAMQAYRCSILYILLGKSYRELSIKIAESVLLQRFILQEIFDTEQIRVPSKSTLERFSKIFSTELISEQINELLKKISGEKNILNLQDPFYVKDVYIDATCLKANMHFPVDWVLIGDCASTILQAIIVIRKHGLKYRIKDPKVFISQINAHLMSMTSAIRNKKNKKKRKTCFRKLKIIAKIILNHAKRYVSLLQKNGVKKTDLSKAQIAKIVEKLNSIIEIFPVAIDQAHSRIISNKQVENKKKLLSIYHEDVNVIKRGKAGGQVEFGNTLFLAEQADGVIVDWHLYRTDVKDPQATKESITRLINEFGTDLKSITGDRGCQSKTLSKLLKKQNIYDGLCPRSPLEFVERIKDPKFRKHQKRRAQTEGRIGILKNKFLKGALFERTFKGKEQKVAWAILTHNLWCLARLPKKLQEVQKAS